MELKHYQVAWKYVDKVPPPRKVKDASLQKGGYDAEVLIDTIYLTIDIALSPKMLKKFREKRYAELTLVLIHELAHEYTDEMCDQAETTLTTRIEREALRKLNESNTERIARVVFSHLPREIWMP